MKSPRLFAAIVCAVLLAGCGNGAATGTGVNLTASGGPNNLFPSAAPSATKAAVKPKPSKSAGPTSPRSTAPAPRATAAQPAAFTINIYGDRSGKSLIDPPQAAVYTGTKVVWRNTDTKPHGVEAQNGAFSSGDIPPGGTWTWVAGAPGTYAYQDISRPYVNASIQVAAR